MLIVAPDEKKGLIIMNRNVNSQRPVNLDLRTIKLPITAYASILHRISGVILFVCIVIALYLLGTSLSGPEGFATVKSWMSNIFVKIILWGMLSALLYHMVAGIRHLIMDLGFAENLEGGRLGAKLVLVLSVILILMAGVWVILW